MIQENRETFNVAIRLSSSSCLKSLFLGTSSSTVTIIDDDGNLYYRQFSDEFLDLSLHDTSVNMKEWMNYKTRANS